MIALASFLGDLKRATSVPPDNDDDWYMKDGSAGVSAAAVQVGCSGGMENLRF